MAHRKIRPGTLVGLDRPGLYKVFADRGFTKGCEVGVRDAENARAMLDIIPNLELLLVDPYMVYEYLNLKRRNKWKWHKPAMDDMRFRALRRLAQDNVMWLMTTSEKAAQCVEDESLDFVYIDGNHTFNFIMQDILMWANKVRKGGVISGHDWGIKAVQKAVWNYAKYNSLKVSVTDRMKEKGQSRTLPSWMIEK